jgi:hypothetical protein
MSVIVFALLAAAAVALDHFARRIRHAHDRLDHADCDPVAGLYRIIGRGPTILYRNVREYDR